MPTINDPCSDLIGECVTLLWRPLCIDDAGLPTAPPTFEATLSLVGYGTQIIPAPGGGFYSAPNGLVQTFSALESYVDGDSCVHWRIRTCSLPANEDSANTIGEAGYRGLPDSGSVYRLSGRIDGVPFLFEFSIDAGIDYSTDYVDGCIPIEIVETTGTVPVLVASNSFGIRVAEAIEGQTIDVLTIEALTLPNLPATGTDAANRNYVEQAIAALQGNHVGQSTTYAGLPMADTDGGPLDIGDIASLQQDDGPNLKGFYRWNGSSWQLSLAVPNDYTAGTGLALSGNQFSIADDGVDTAQIADDAVRNAQILNGAITAVKISDSVNLTDFDGTKVTGPVNLNNQRIVGLGAAVAVNDAATFDDVLSRFGALNTTDGVADWDTHTRPGTSLRLLNGTDANGPGPARLFHAFNLVYASKTAPGNVTQFAIPYGRDLDLDEGLFVRGRFSGTWSAWYKVGSRVKLNELLPGDGFVEVENTEGFRHVSDVVASGNTVKNKVASFFDVNGTSWSLRPSPDGAAYSYTDSIAYNFTANRWQFEGDVRLGGAFDGASTILSNIADGVGNQDAVTVSQARAIAATAPYRYSTVSVTAVAADAGGVVEIQSSSARTFTIPNDSTYNFPVGTRIDVFRSGTGALTIAAAGGVSIRSKGNLLGLAAQYSGATLFKRTANDWALIGDLV